ncbi:MAG: crossover junction endodeoxyribonuclease RuvC [Sphingomonadaceae bacterium]
MIVLGLDPGLERTGWGLVALAAGGRLAHVASGCVTTRPADPLAARLAALFDGLLAVVAAHAPDTAAVEETFVNAGARSALRLGAARGVVLLAAARCGSGMVGEYAPAVVKKAVVGTGAADKAQVAHMVRLLLPGARPETADAADALAIAICHAHHLRLGRAVAA